ncbi:MAG: hypothetical protein KR126chlam2_00515 [Chlamydiae bacterium]|nr:hypothetical protein [Chlamydiota bacterium]
MGPIEPGKIPEPQWGVKILEDFIENFSSGSPTVEPAPPEPPGASKARRQTVQSTVVIPDKPANEDNKTILVRVKNALSSMVQFAKSHPWLTGMFVVGTLLILLAFPTVAGAIAGFTGLSIIGAHIALTIPYGIIIYYYGVMLINYARNIAIKKDYQTQIEQLEISNREMLTDSIQEARASLRTKQVKVDTIHGKTLKRLDDLEQEKKKTEEEIRNRAEGLRPIESARDTTETAIVEQFPLEAQPLAKKMVEKTREGIVDGMATLSEIKQFPPAISLELEIDLPPFPSPAQEKNLPIKKRIGERLGTLFKPAALASLIKEQKLATLIVASGIAVATLAYPLLGAASVFATIGLGVYGILLIVEGYNLTADNQAKERLKELGEEGDKQLKQWQSLKETRKKIETFVPQFKKEQARLIKQREGKLKKLQQNLRPPEEAAAKIMLPEYEVVIQILKTIDPKADSYPSSQIQAAINTIHSGAALVAESTPRPHTQPRAG